MIGSHRNSNRYAMQHTKIMMTTFEELVAQLSDDDADVRAGAVVQLGGSRDERAIAPLISALGDEFWSVNYHAAFFLKDFGEAAIKSLIEVVENGTVIARCYAAYALAKMGDQRAIETLLAALKAPSWRMRGDAAEALGTFSDDPHLVEPLLSALNDEHYWVRTHAARALSLFKDDRVVDALIASLRDQVADVRSGATYALKFVKEGRVVEPLLTALRDENEHVRGDAAFALGTPRDDDERVVEPLVVALNDKSKHVRFWAAKSLVRWREKRAVEPVLLMLQDENDDLRSVAAEILGKLGDARAVEPLMSALKDTSYVATFAALSLGQIGDIRAINPLIDSLNHPSGSVRGYAARALGLLGDDRAIGPLINRLTDTGHGKWELVCESAAAALTRLGTPEALAAVEKWRASQQLDNHAIE
jgi:HEAT repeat protein